MLAHDISIRHASCSRSFTTVTDHMCTGPSISLPHQLHCPYGGMHPFSYWIFFLKEFSVFYVRVLKEVCSRKSCTLFFKVIYERQISSLAFWNNLHNRFHRHQQSVFLHSWAGQWTLHVLWGRYRQSCDRRHWWQLAVYRWRQSWHLAPAHA